MGCISDKPIAAHFCMTGFQVEVISSLPANLYPDG